jgi:hypothetical protein
VQEWVGLIDTSTDFLVRQVVSSNSQYGFQ